ncbi:hypothetical protein MGYG_02701 [Nannizzia gypsea CBS 118893]|uniref:Cytochrome P450 n=1 Tax=Arthroderma gypseum (strain ATCC MYA-4604 / CBS 118893) TaxID=535722 RepID=E4UNT5_ARTGP|nr:hypothetical protein MGYG_02701 [Nannizzia gypsea CBS 118893]EFQ99688.1 hypothetical protein MGYG_02701 [Nannizzia gypsea CBS 118893]
MAALKKIVYNHYFGPLSSVPMAPGDWFIFGHTPYMFGAIPGGWILDFVNQNKYNDYGMIRTEGILHLSDSVILTHPYLFHKVLSTRCYDHIKPPKRSEFNERIVGRGIATAELAEHRAHRKSVRPAFLGHVIKELIPKMWLKALDFSGYMAIESNATDGAIEFTRFVSLITLDVIGVAAFGEDFKSLYGPQNELAATFRQMLKPTRAFIQYLIVTEKKDVVQKGGKHGTTILSVLLRNGEFSDDSVRDQMLTFLFAGHETTSISITFAMYLLATQPEIQERLRVEVRGVLSQYRPDELTDRTFDSMPLLAAVVSEALRIWPVAPRVARVGRETHGGTNHPLAKSITFLFGPRSCIGQSFARAEMKCLVASMVYRFKIEMLRPDEDFVVAGALAIKPANGLHLRLTDIANKSRPEFGPQQPLAAAPESPRRFSVPDIANWVVQVLPGGAIKKDQFSIKEFLSQTVGRTYLSRPDTRPVTSRLHLRTSSPPDLYLEETGSEVLHRRGTPLDRDQQASSAGP